MQDSEGSRRIVSSAYAKEGDGEMMVWISGPTCAGKSSLCRHAGELGIAVVREHVPKNLFRAFQFDPRSTCFDLQKAIIASRVDTWRALENRRTVVFDRSPSEDYEVFCRLHRDCGFLTDDEFVELATFEAAASDALPAPDAIVYLRPPERVLLERLLGTGQPNVIVDRLSEQLAYYDGWFDRRHEERLAIDNSRCREGTLRAILEGLVR